jgi:hypothetical protein
MLAITLIAHGQEQPQVVATYERHARIGNFFTQWYYNARGTSTMWKEHLTLYDNQTYRYAYSGGECATFDRDESGQWEKSGHSLLLNGEERYRIKEDRLYIPGTPIHEKTWVMKKVK